MLTQRFQEIADLTAALVDLHPRHESDEFPTELAKRYLTPTEADRFDSLRSAHLPRVSKKTGIMANPGSQATVKAVRLTEESPAKVATAMAVAQGDPRTGCAITEMGLFRGMREAPPTLFGYRYEGSWQALANRLDMARQPAAYTTLDIERFALDMGATHLAASYAARLWAEAVGYSCKMFMQMHTPGPVGCAHDLAVEYHEAHDWIMGTINEYPSMHDASALMCEMYRVNRHVLGKVNYAAKRGRTARGIRFGDYASWHADWNSFEPRRTEDV